MLSARNPSKRAGKSVRTSNRIAGGVIARDTPARSGRRGLRREPVASSGGSRSGGLRRFGQCPGFAVGRLLDAMPLQDRRHFFRRLRTDRQPVANPVDVQNRRGFRGFGPTGRNARAPRSAAHRDRSASPWRRSGKRDGVAGRTISCEDGPLEHSLKRQTARTHGKSSGDIYSETRPVPSPRRPCAPDRSEPLWSEPLRASPVERNDLNCELE